MFKLKPKNWSNFQHYNRRTPPWVKLHRTLLDDFDYQRLPLASRALAPMLWLLASEHNDGVFDASVEFLCFRLRCPESEIRDGLKPLIDGGFFIVASGALADCKQPSIVETETEGETEERQRQINGAAAPNRFDDFWAAYPKKREKKKSREIWKRKKLDTRADTIIADVQTREAHDRQWIDGFIPNPTTYLNGERWEDEISKPRSSASAAIEYRRQRQRIIPEEQT